MADKYRQRYIDQEMARFKAQRVPAVQASEMMKQRLRDYDSRYGVREDEGFLKSVLRGFARPIVKTAASLIGAPVEMAAQLQRRSAHKREAGRVSKFEESSALAKQARQATDPAERQRLLEQSRQVAAGAGDPSVFAKGVLTESLPGGQKLMTQEEAEQLARPTGAGSPIAGMPTLKGLYEQGVKPGAGLVAYGIPVGKGAMTLGGATIGAGNIASKVGLGALAGAGVSLGAVPETATPLETAQQVGVGAAIAGGTTFVLAKGSAMLRKWAESVAKKRDASNKLATFIARRIIKPPTSQNVGWNRDQKKVVHNLVDDAPTDLVLPEQWDDYMDDSLRATESQIDDYLAKPHPKMRMDGLQDEIYGDINGVIDKKGKIVRRGIKGGLSRYSRNPEDLAARSDLQHFVGQMDAMSEFTPSGKVIDPRTIMDSKKLLGHQMAGDKVWQRMADGTTTKSDQVLISAYNTLKRMVDQNTGYKISDLTMKQHHLITAGYGVKAWGMRGGLGQASSMRAGPVMNRLLQTGQLAAMGAAQVGRALPKAGAAALRGAAAIPTALERPASLGLPMISSRLQSIARSR